ncbi:hypothetical protein BD779DRAFT_1453295 [Infundibulicybe gibba]|nr:hypothetical protein BD779DRAFT_1453295 [Infundibulicybe gibba]
MPSPSDTKAPCFDPAQPRSLQHFFEELDFWFEDIGITSDTQKKRYARRYTDFSTAELWQALPEYASTPSPSPSLYSDFVSAIIALYPEADPRTRFADVTDLAVIVSRQVRLATQTCAHIGEYYRSFYPVAASLVAQGGLAKVKRDELFLIGFGPSFSCCVKWKLEITMGLSPHGSYSIENAYHVALAVAHSLEALE